MEITKDIIYIGVNDHDIDLFEGQYAVPAGMAYNSYVIKDEKIAVMDTVDAHFGEQWLANLRDALDGRAPDYLVVQHMEPDHSANIAAFAQAYPDATIVASAKAFTMMKNFFGTDYAERRTVVGDGECGEGSIWEAAMYAHQYKLGNLVVFVDRNGMSFDGPTEEYMALEPFADKWRAFGWNTVTIDGHDMNAILDAIDALPAPDSDVPTVIIGKTVKGHGVSFMENNVSWHAGCVNEADWIKAKAEITEAYERKWGAEA